MGERSYCLTQTKALLFVRAAWENEEFLFQTASDEEIVCFCSKWATLYTTQPFN
jgi:hypothetical protein